MQEDNSKVLAAIELAYKYHTKPRKSSIVPNAPYTCHLAGVASEVAECGGSQEAIAAAWLHDMLEDVSSESANEILDACGPVVLSLVRECTEIGTGDGGDFKAPWKTRKDAYLAHIATVSQEALLISVADKLQSARNLKRMFQRMDDDAYLPYVKEAPENERKSLVLWFHRSLEVAFQARLEALGGHVGIQALIDDFAEIVGYLHKY